MDAVSADHQVFAVPTFSRTDTHKVRVVVSLWSGPFSELERILLQVLLHPPGQRELLHVCRALVDAQAAQVLQAGNAVLAAQRPDQLQVHRRRRHLLLQGR